MLVLVMIIALCAHIGHCQVSQGSVQRQSDVQVLLIFRSSIENWDAYAQANNIQGWRVEVPVCTWTGISCTDTGDIASLTLQCGACPVRATGLLPPDLARLSSLSTLNLEGQAFRGPLPGQWFEPDAWPQLANMFLSGNPIGGTLPRSQSGSLRSLGQLRLNDCNLSGTLPASWGRDETSMRRLNVIRAAKNAFTGTLPQEWGTAASFPELSTLDLSDNQLSGQLPELWGNPKAALYLQEIYLRGNNFTGGLPPSFGAPDALVSLRYLSLARNPIGGQIPPEWSQPGSFKELRSLDLNDTGLAGPLPSTIPSAFPQLQSMLLPYNNLSGPIPPSYANATNLERVVVKPGNPLLCGPVPDNLPFQLCDDRDLTCLRIPVELLPVCPAGLPPESEFVPGVEVLPGGSGTITGSTGNNSTNSTAGTFGAPTPASDSGGGSNTGAIVGGVVGGVVGLLALLTAALFIVRRRRKTARSKSFMTSSSSPISYGTSYGTSYGGDKPSLRPFMSEEEEGAAAAAAALEGGFGGNDGGYGAMAINGVVPGGASPTGVPSTSGGILSPLASRPLSSVLSSIKSSMIVRNDRRSATNKLAPMSSGAVSAGGPSLSATEAIANMTRQGSTDAMSGGIGSGSTTYESGVMSVRSSYPDSESVSPDQLPWDDWQVGLSELEVCHRPDGTEHMIGSGGFGKVYKALRNGVQPVAVKVIPASTRADGDPKGKDSTRQEIAILRACRDANIVQFQGAYLGTDQTLLVTEYMEGGDLMANIAAGRVNWWRRGRKIAIDVAKGLCFLHARRIVHFDLKSPNILLTRDGTAKIADVGMAKFLNRDYVSAVVATLSWSAPEMLWGAKCTEKADIYSYGIVLWEICTGEIPERGRLRDIKVPEECPEEVRALILECLETRPSMRPSALQIVERLQAVPKLSGPAAIRAAPQAAGVEEPNSSTEIEEGSPETIHEVPQQPVKGDGSGGDGGSAADISVVVPSSSSNDP